MEKHDALLPPADQQLHEITRLLLEQQAACEASRAIDSERREEKEMRRLEKDDKWDKLHGQVEMLKRDGEDVRRSASESDSDGGVENRRWRFVNELNAAHRRSCRFAGDASRIHSVLSTILDRRSRRSP